jgi:immune inhibitor A
VEPNGIEGFSNGWVDLNVDLSAFTGDVMLGFRYSSDGGVNEAGFMIDELLVSGYPVDGAEADAGWTFAGFRVTSGTEDKMYSQYYVAEFRTYKGYDRGLKTGPYYFGYLNDPLLGNWVDHFPIGGMLLLLDTRQTTILACIRQPARRRAHPQALLLRMTGYLAQPHPDL